VLLDLARLRLDELADPVAAEPAEARPVLVPAVHEDGRRRQDEEVPHALKFLRVGAPLRLFVERGVERDPAQGILALAEDVADRHKPRSSVRAHRRQDAASRGLQERALRLAQDRTERSRHRGRL
jgi:hypothetical protein